jgi:hypothetical protein
MKYTFILYLFVNINIDINIFLIKIKKVWLFEKRDVHLYVDWGSSSH